MPHASLPPPRMIRTRPLVGRFSLMAEHASWRLHLALRGRDFEDDQALRLFVNAQRDVLTEPLPPTASAADRAKESFYASREASEDFVSRRLRRDALDADPGHVDTLVDSALFDFPHSQRLRLLQDALALAKPQGGTRGDDEPGGWPVLTNRPGLRARAALAMHLLDLGRLEEAVAACEELLQLDPEDHQGARYVCVALLLEVGRYETAQQLILSHGEEHSAFFAWAAVLLALETGSDAEAALEVARGRNSRADLALLQPFTVEMPLPRSYEPGSEEEAELIGDLSWRAWHKRPAALAWLRERAAEAWLREELDAPVWEEILVADDGGLRVGVVPFLMPPTRAVVSRLVQILDEGPDEEEPQVAEWAALLLGRLGVASEAVEELLAYLRRWCGIETWGPSEAGTALAGLGAAAVSPILQAYAGETDDDVRCDLVDVLVATAVRDERIFATLAERLEHDQVGGVGQFVDYGDERALPLLSARLDEVDPDAEADSIAESAVDLVDAIHELGGSFTPRQQERFGAVIERTAYHRTPEGRRALEDEILRVLEDQRGEALPSPGPLLPRQAHAPSPSVDALVRPKRPGRNETCWCGSGKKYKRCHLRADEADAD